MNAADFDLKLSTVANYTASSDAATFTHNIPDTTGMVQMSPAAGGQLKKHCRRLEPFGNSGRRLRRFLGRNRDHRKTQIRAKNRRCFRGFLDGLHCAGYG